MKSKALKRQDAEVRASQYTWENSKAKRLGKGTQAEWEARQSR